MKALSAQKQILFALILILAGLVFLEASIRVGAFFLYNRSPYFLFYGFRSVMADDDPEGHSAAYDGYFKFPPNRTLKQYGMFQKPTPIRINSLGFRGEDFSPQKDPNSFRIICLGGSSTFGFFDRDEFTYPSILQRLLNERLHESPIRVEVINAGIPHFTSDNLVSILRNELWQYSPDLITVYSAYNDAVRIIDMTVTQRTLRWLHEHLAIYVALKRLSSMLGGPELHSKYAKYANLSNEDYIKTQVALHRERFDKNLRDIVALARDKGIHVLFIKQPIRMPEIRGNSPEMKWTYEGDLNFARQKLEHGEFLSSEEVTLIIHSELLQTLDGIAKQLSIPVVDNIRIINQHPEYFASYVHLTEEGNQALATALAETIMSNYLTK
ncbi:SGNH/GDSL hydrolase family protein [Nitrospira tepida]|uniref:SGNH/GDSL hydrolase family protein n=1 Tax=Nitrospira tepida TaxID=2973512 RepID=A0AA86N108_9BACT|nr:GDSL-type esterase/lipase family protein [Nitrospira tepida]CAI4032541.1 SGNH/GDSL hydrolase family protein [Nitrospira tepida]